MIDCLFNTVLYGFLFNLPGISFYYFMKKVLEYECIGQQALALRTFPYLVMDFLYMSSLSFSAPQSLITTTELGTTRTLHVLVLTALLQVCNIYKISDHDN